MSVNGIVCEDEYTKSDIKILYLLKEENNTPLNFDLLEFIRNGGRWQTWNNIARWTEGILNLPNKKEWYLLDKINLEYRKKWLNKIAVVNLKKTVGGSFSDDEIIASATRKNKELIETQIKNCKPNIVICGGTAWIYFKNVAKYDNDKWQVTSEGIGYFKHLDTIFIESYHPQARVRDNFLYYMLMNSVQEVLSLK